MSNFSPTNRRAQINHTLAGDHLPAVLLYYLCFHDNVKELDAIHFLLIAAQLGILFKKGATISAALGGCQAEIGVSSAMAAAALTESLGGER